MKQNISEQLSACLAVWASDSFAYIGAGTGRVGDSETCAVDTISVLIAQKHNSKPRLIQSKPWLIQIFAKTAGTNDF